MNLDAYRAWIRHAPLPTDDQCQRFAWHVIRAHSWYKGSLRRGTRVVVYIDPEVGGGFTGGRRVRDRTWHIASAEYREAYGRLAYRWGVGPGYSGVSDYYLETVDETRAPHAVVSTDHPGPDLPSEIVEQCGFDLYPFTHSREFFAYADILRHKDALRAIWAGRPHPHRRLLCQLDEADFGGASGLDHDAKARHRRKAVCLEKTEHLQIMRALQRMLRLIGG